jgi:hypothetical protein
METGFCLDREHLARRMHYPGAFPAKNHRGRTDANHGEIYVDQTAMQGANLHFQWTSGFGTHPDHRFKKKVSRYSTSC